MSRKNYETNAEPGAALAGALHIADLFTKTRAAHTSAEGAVNCRSGSG